MAKVYVAFQQSGVRIASGSQSTLRKRISEHRETTWGIYLYDVKTNVDTLVALMEGNLQALGTPKPVESVRVNAQGQVRKFDPSTAG